MRRSRSSCNSMITDNTVAGFNTERYQVIGRCVKISFIFLMVSLVLMTVAVIANNLIDAYRERSKAQDVALVEATPAQDYAVPISLPDGTKICGNYGLSSKMPDGGEASHNYAYTATVVSAERGELSIEVRDEGGNVVDNEHVLNIVREAVLLCCQ